MISFDQQTFVTIIDYLGTFAFAISGIRIARIKEFDLFGAFIVGMVTAVGGGTLRDLMLGQSPFWMTQWQYFVVTGVALLSYIFFHKAIDKVGRTMFLFDAIGLGLFTVVGFQKTIDAGFPYWTANLMGMLTGAAGGVLRDVLTRDVPLIFRHDIYALACFAGGIVLTNLMLMGVPLYISHLLCALTVIFIRVLAVRYHWQLPVLNNDKGMDEKEAS